MKDVTIRILKKYRWKILLVIFLVFINVYLLSLPSKIVGNIVDALYNLEQNKENILNSTYFLIFVCIIVLLLRIVWKYYENDIVRGFERDLKIDLFNRFLKLKETEVQNIKNGELMSYFIKDINEIRRAIYRILSHGTRIIFTLGIIVFQMIQGVNLNLTIAVMIPILIGTYSVVKIKKYVEKSFKKSQKYFTSMSEYMQESTDGIKTIKAYSCEEDKLKEFIKKNKNVYSSNNTVEIFSNMIKLSLDICFGACYAISLIYGSALVINNTITVGELVTFNGYIALFNNPINWLPQIISVYKRAQISYHRLEKVYNLNIEEPDEKAIIPNEKLVGDIKIKNLSFSYPGFIGTVLDNISLNIKEGQTIGIIGTVGSGKTTLMDLLTKLYNLPDGKITIGGKDINNIPAETIRDNICYITQDAFLFSSSIKDNISLFDENYDEYEIENSTKEAILDEDIEKFSNGIYTIIGENGEDLSGGQRQRVTISRAFLKNSSILIFDDTFSALDNKTSKRLIKNINKLAKGKTCIIISNKVSDVKYSDKIIVLENGKIQEEGTHDELIANHNIYFKFYMQQAKNTKSNLLN